MTTNAHFKIYLDNTIELVKSLVIKLDVVATAMNRELTDYGYKIPNEKREWRYYRHLAGDYHHLDQPMMITSLDDNTEIEFTKENLKLHKKTRSIYLYTNSYPEELAERYPAQSNLVWGILRPISYTNSINAANGTVLNWDSRLIESQEQRLIPEIEAWIQGHHYKYMMESFVETDDLFATTFVAQLYAYLPVKIMDIRYKYVKTAQTHSYHIIQYFASNNRIDEFVQYLTLEQMLFLYRNLLYIEKNTGQQETFDDLVKNLLTVRNLPTYSYALRQKQMDLDERLTPNPTFVRDQINLRTGLSSRDLDEWPISDIVFKEVPLARDNHINVAEYTQEAEELTSYSTISELPTKVLEVSAIDPEDIQPVKLIDVLLNEWVHMAAIDQYNNMAEILNPLNGDTIKLDMKDLFILYYYAHFAGFHGIDMNCIGPFMANGVLKKRWIGADEYLALVEHDHFDGWDDDVDFFINTHYEFYESIVSKEEFMDNCQEILKRKRVRHQYIFQAQRFRDRVGRKKMYEHSYDDNICKLDVEGYGSYQDFFLRYAVDYKNISAETWQDLAMECLDAATNFGSQNTISLKEIQAAMVRLFKRLSSYTIQFIEEILSDDTTVSDPCLPIPDMTKEHVSADAFIHRRGTTVVKDTALGRMNTDTRMNLPTITEATLIEDRHQKVQFVIEAAAREDAVSHVSMIRPTSTVRSYATSAL